MSTIGVACHKEDVRNIIRQPTEPILKSPRYKSKTRFKNIGKGSKDRSTGHDTFGYAHYEVDPPWNYLKKGKRKVYQVQPLGKFSTKLFLKSNINAIALRSVAFHKFLYDERITCVTDKKEFECTLKSNRPPVPKWKFECPKGKAKNFVRENIKWADSLEPAVPFPRQVDSPRGNVQDLSKIFL